MAWWPSVGASGHVGSPSGLGVAWEPFALTPGRTTISLDRRSSLGEGQVVMVVMSWPCRQR